MGLGDYFPDEEGGEDEEGGNNSSSSPLHHNQGSNSATTDKAGKRANPGEAENSKIAGFFLGGGIIGGIANSVIMTVI